jgi:glycosyltransferase involved in cell wall biosynthesis
MKRLLFIGHDATRTGAPFVLLYLLRWIKVNHPECELDLLLLAGGEIETIYREVANVTVVPVRQPKNLVSDKLHSLRARLSDEVRLGVSGLPHLTREYDAVIGNTAVTLRHLGLFKQRGYRTVSWIHELDGALATLGLADQFRSLARGADRFIVGSNAVGDMLRRRGISKPVDRVYEFSPPRLQAASDPSAVRRELRIPSDAFVVGACGTLEHRKGADLFARLADELKHHPDFYFIWVARANAATEPMYAEFRNAMFSSAFSERFQLVISAAGDHERWLAAMDVFVLPSREDPFPLVCLEAANYAKPIICFEGAGGMPEFVGDDAGAAVPIGNVQALAAAVEGFYLDPASRLKAGAAAKRKAGNEFSAERSCPEIFAILSRLD